MHTWIYVPENERGTLINPNTSFTASSVKLQTLLENAREGRLQLPDFQRSWVWDEERIKSLIASVSRAFPVGALTTRHSSC